MLLIETVLYDSFENTINMNSNIKFDKQIKQKTLTKNNIKVKKLLS